MSDQGWGATSYGGSLSDVLLEVEVPVVSKEQCLTSFADLNNMTVEVLQNYADTDSMLCAGGVEGEDACQVSARPPALEFLR